MPSHRPTEPPNEDHGWKAEYDKIMESDEGKEMLDGLGRTEYWVDEDALQAFVQMVYGRGHAHGMIFRFSRIAFDAPKTDASRCLWDGYATEALVGDGDRYECPNCEGSIA